MHKKMQKETAIKRESHNLQSHMSKLQDYSHFPLQMQSHFGIGTSHVWQTRVKLVNVLARDRLMALPKSLTFMR